MGCLLSSSVQSGLAPIWQVATFLVDKGATRSERILDAASSQLVRAAAAGDVASARRAIADGADVNRGDYDLRTVWLLARGPALQTSHGSL